MREIKVYAIEVDGDVRVIRTNAPPKSYVCIVPDSIPSMDYGCLKVVEVNGKQSVEVDQDKKSKMTISIERNAELKRVRDNYVTDIDSEMKKVFGTTNKDKANSLYLTWELMCKDPAMYSDKGLKDMDGLPLDTQAKVYEFAKLRVQLCKDYSIFLIKRSDQYYEEKRGANI